jgi:hypothetical protein
MKSRTLVILIALVVAAALLTVVLEREPAPSGDDLRGQRLVPGLADSLNDVTALEIEAGGEDGLTTVRRGEAGWTVSERAGYPADAGQIRRFLIRLGQARIVEPKTSNPDLYYRLGVGEAGTDGGGVKLTLQGLPEPVSVIVGNVETRAGTGTYVRLAGEEQSHLVDVTLDPNRTPVGWLDQSLFDIEPDEVDAIDIRQDDGSELRIARDSGELYVLDIPEGRRLESPGAPRSMAGVLMALELEDVRPVADFEGEPPAAIAQYELTDGRRITARLWQRDDGRYAAFRLAYEAPPAADEETPEGASDPAGDGAAQTAGEEPAPAEETSAGEEVSLADQAADHDARLAPWAFRIPAHKYDQMTRRLDDLLAAPEPAPETE